ncbi:phosphatidate cytidylyltransferase [Methylophaga sp.]|uniref:phosphatidate cytidylyltransferase n=1 Tax=Methylophaga sp. TaxID=2024840 RepID=UPI003F69FF4C
MLKQRLITAAVLIPLVVWALLALHTDILRYLLGFIAVLAAVEWLQLMGFKQKIKIAGIVITMVLTGFLCFVYMPTFFLLAATLLVWLMATILVVLFAHKPLPVKVVDLFRSRFFGVMIATIILIGFVASASLIHNSSEQGPILLLFGLVSVWLADTGGYFAGKRYGKNKLAKAISPNKTWEGVAGGLVLSGIFALVFYVSLLDTNMSLFSWLLITGVIVLISIVGDLFESVFKRCFNVKDSGQLLPGHGGMLDRIDSLLAAVPVFAGLLIASGA